MGLLQQKLHHRNGIDPRETFAPHFLVHFDPQEKSYYISNEVLNPQVLVTTSLFHTTYTVKIVLYISTVKKI